MKNINITIVGFGNIGRCILQQLLVERTHTFCINIIDLDPNLSGSFLDFSHSNTLFNQHQLIWNSKALFESSEFIFHCAGPSVPKNATRLSIAKESKAITTSIFKNFKSKVNPFIIVISNPVDVISHLTYQLTGLDSCRVIGTGTLLDTIRMKYNLRQTFPNQQVTTQLLGEHGDSIVFMESKTFIDGIPINQLLDTNAIKQCVVKTKKSPTLIKATQGATFYAVSNCAVSILHQILTPTDTILPLSTFIPTQFQQIFKCDPLYMGMPVRITKNGISIVRNFECSDHELIALRKSAKIIANYL
jgi:malate/lactate dehydrogenase